MYSSFPKQVCLGITKKTPYMIGTATRDKTATPIKLCMGHTCASKYTGIVYYKDGSHVYS